ncbi:MAG: PIN domain-containing protein [Desulfurococcales archaeon]|nr:PIN domain-containing protein [Desulfurococcales archaeon]
MEANRLGLCPPLDRSRLAIIIDTNLLIYMAKGLVSPSMILEAVERSYKLIVCNQVVRELETLSERAPKLSTRRLSRKALSLLGSLNACIAECPGEEADDAVLLLAISLARSGTPVILATSDRGLRRRARSHGVPTLYYRESEGRLETDWEPL